jgi:peptide/nickel transport system permease protein
MGHRGTHTTCFIYAANRARTSGACISLRFALPVSTGGIGVYQFVAGAIVLAIPLIAIFLAQLRDGLASAMNEDFVLYARAKGLSEWAIVWRHASRAAINPFLTIAGLSLAGCSAGR